MHSGRQIILGFSISVKYYILCFQTHWNLVRFLYLHLLIYSRSEFDIIISMNYCAHAQCLNTINQNKTSHDHWLLKYMDCCWYISSIQVHIFRWWVLSLHIFKKNQCTYFLEHLRTKSCPPTRTDRQAETNIPPSPQLHLRGYKNVSDSADLHP